MARKYVPPLTYPPPPGPPHIKTHRVGEYIYIIYTPNLGLGIAVFDREREQGCFRGSSGSREGAGREHTGVVG